MKKIAVITSTRAEYGLLMPVIAALKTYETSELKIELVVTGTHLSAEYGHTLNEIQDSGIYVDRTVEIPVASKNAADISNNQAITLIKFTELFCTAQYDCIVILGDRYEMLAVAIAAGNTQIPIFHLCGGDTTEGAMDEWIRHSITKMSYLHFPTNEESYQRILQLGEAPDRVFNYGSTSIDNIITIANMSKAEALGSLGMQDCSYAICTYHPVTLEKGNMDQQIFDFLEAVKAFPELAFIVTKSNADQGGAYINELLDNAEKAIENLHIFSSLGAARYLSLMKYSEFVLGNSSSGIIEAPAFGIPTINIGDRQRGRLQADSIINCAPDKESIIASIKRALDEKFKITSHNTVNPYGSGHAARQIAAKIVEVVQKDEINLKKKFYDNK